MNDFQYVSKETLEQMKAELQRMKSVDRPAASRAIAEAREKGDLKENAEYDAAKEAQGIGLVARVFPATEFAASARAIAEQVACAPRGAGLIKRAVNHANFANLENDLEYEAHLQEIAGRSFDYDEGVKAFLEKRTPVFTGK